MRATRRLPSSEASHPMPTTHPKAKTGTTLPRRRNKPRQMRTSKESAPTGPSP